jgi:hypothetical protein
MEELNKNTNSVEEEKLDSSKTPKSDDPNPKSSSDYPTLEEAWAKARSSRINIIRY